MGGWRRTWKFSVFENKSKCFFFCFLFFFVFVFFSKISKFCRMIMLKQLLMLGNIFKQ